MSGHLTCTATLSKSRHISTLNYLRSADICQTRTRTVIYWLSVPAITDSANKCNVFGGHFNPKSLAARTLTCDRQFAQMSMLPSSDRKQYFISRVNSCVMNHVIVDVERLPSSWCGKTQIARIEANRVATNKRAIVVERHSGCRLDMKYFEHQKLTYVDYKCSPTVQYLSCYIMMH